VSAAVSLGSFGCSIPGMQEYTGDFNNATRAEITAFHRWRLEIISSMMNDFKATGQKHWIAFETIPSVLEVEVIASLVDEFDFEGVCDVLVSLFPFPTHPYGVLEKEIVDSSKNFVEECTRILASSKNVHAIGLNCFPENRYEEIPELLETINSVKRKDQSIACYGNAMEGISIESYGQQAIKWINSGASIIGGCCGTTPKYIAHLKDLFDKEGDST
jgi:S-methylmethionine-dependent homocysteine/selenocysteine methylase